MIKDMEDITYKRTNRQQAKKPKRVAIWCGCDREVVSLDDKCPICGSKHKSGRLKKEPL